MDPEFLLAHCRQILRRESDHMRGPQWSGDWVEHRQRTLSEAEFAHRLRAVFTDPDTVMNAQGRQSERDIVAYGHQLEIELKYFAGASPQGQQVALSDWHWLTGQISRPPVRPGFRRFWWLVFPRAAMGANPKGRPRPGSHHLPDQPGRWRFQQCLSMDVGDDDVPRPFAPFVSKLAQGLAFRSAADMRRNATFPVPVCGQNVQVRADLHGQPYEDAVWGVLYSVT